MEKRAMALLLLLLLMMVSGFDTDFCGLKRARGCSGSYPATLEIQRAAASALTSVTPTVVATAFTDIRRLPDSYLVLVEMPGVNSSDHVKVEVVQQGRVHLLSIAGVSREDSHVAVRLRNDRGAFTKLFARKFVLPAHVEPGKVTHRLDHGLLRVKLPILDSLLAAEEDHPRLRFGEDVKLALNYHPRLPPFHCTIPYSEELIQAEDLLATVQPACDDLRDEVTIWGLADMWEHPERYELVVEMPGARSAKVDVNWGVNWGFKWDDAGGFVMEVAGVADELEDFDEVGEAVRIERGGASRKLFSRRLFLPHDILAAHSNSTTTYDLRHGLLRINLPRLPFGSSNTRCCGRDHCPLPV